MNQIKETDRLSWEKFVENLIEFVIAPIAVMAVLIHMFAYPAEHTNRVYTVCAYARAKIVKTVRQIILIKVPKALLTVCRVCCSRTAASCNLPLLFSI